MPNIGWPELLMIAGALAALRAVAALISGGNTMGSVLIGFLLVAAGFWLYVQVSPSWSQAQSFLGQVSMALDPKMQSHVARIQQYYYAAVISMAGGGLLILMGFVRQVASGAKK